MLELLKYVITKIGSYVRYEDGEIFSGGEKLLNPICTCSCRNQIICRSYRHGQMYPYMKVLGIRGSWDRQPCAVL